MYSFLFLQYKQIKINFQMHSSTESLLLVMYGWHIPPVNKDKETFHKDNIIQDSFWN